MPNNVGPERRRSRTPTHLVTRLLVAPVPDLGHRQLACTLSDDRPSGRRTLEATADPVVDTLRLAPRGFRQTRIAVRLVSPERLDPLLHDRAIGLGRHAGAMSAQASRIGAQSADGQPAPEPAARRARREPNIGRSQSTGRPLAVRPPNARRPAARPSSAPQHSVASSEQALAARASQRMVEAAPARRASGQHLARGRAQPHESWQRREIGADGRARRCGKSSRRDGRAQQPSERSTHVAGVVERQRELGNRGRCQRARDLARTTRFASSCGFSLHSPGQSDAAGRLADRRARATRKFAPLALVARPLALSVRERALEVATRARPLLDGTARTALSPRPGRMSALARLVDDSATWMPNAC